MDKITTIKISKETKKILDSFRTVEGQTYESLIKILIGEKQNLERKINLNKIEKEVIKKENGNEQSEQTKPAEQFTIERIE